MVFGGQVKDPQSKEFVDPDKLDIVGIYPNYEKALAAWRAASQAHVDDAEVKYVVVHMHKMLVPDDE